MPPRCTMPSQPSTRRITASPSLRSQGTTSSPAPAGGISATSDRRRILAWPRSLSRSMVPKVPAAPVIRIRFIIKVTPSARAGSSRRQARR